MADLHNVLVAILGIVAVLVLSWLGWALITRYRRNLLKYTDDGPATWTLDDLREMRQSGQITDEEYRALRQQLIHRSVGSPGSQPGITKSSDPSDR